MSDSGRDAIRERLLKYGVVSRKWGVANARHKEDFYTTITYMRNHGYKITKEKLPRDTLYYLDDFKIGRGKMSRFDAETITDLVFELVGETEAYGDTYIDSVRVKNQQIMCDVIDLLILRIYKNTKYANRNEWSMKDIGMKAMEFLGYLVEEYDLNDYVVRKEE